MLFIIYFYTNFSVTENYQYIRKRPSEKALIDPKRMKPDETSMMMPLVTSAAVPADDLLAYAMPLPMPHPIPLNQPLPAMAAISSKLSMDQSHQRALQVGMQEHSSSDDDHLEQNYFDSLARMPSLDIDLTTGLPKTG